MKTRLLLVVLTLIGTVACNSDTEIDRQRYYLSGREYLEQGRYQEATIQFRNALQIDEGDTASLLGLAESLEGIGDHRGAVEALATVIEQEPGNVRARLWLGRKYYLPAGSLDPESFQKASTEAEEVLAIEPGNVEALILLGNARAGLQDFEGSLKALGEALEVAPGNLDAYLALGRSHVRGDQAAEAEKAFLEAVAKHPDSVQAQVALGAFYASSKRLDEAEESFRRAFELAPESRATLDALVALYLVTNQPEQAEAVYRKAIDTSKDPLHPQLGLADFLIARGKVEEGLALLRQLRSERPENTEVGLSLSRVLLGAGDSDGGAAILSSILESDPTNSEAHYLMGVALSLETDFDSALEQLDRAIELRPTLVAAHLAKADLLQRQGRPDEAETVLRTALDLDRNNLQARAKLAKVQALKGDSVSQLETARSEAGFVLTRIPGNFDALVARAEASLALNRLDDAKRDYQELHQRDSKNPLFLNRLGRIAAREGRAEAALGYYRQVVQLFPDRDAINAIVEILVAQGKEPAALRELDRLATHTERQDVIHFVRGKVFVAQKAYGRAEQEFRQSIALNPENYAGYLALAQTALAQNRVEQAIAEIDALIARDEQFAPGHLQRAYLLQASNQLSAAVESYRRALDLLPKDSKTYAEAANNLAWLMHRTGGDLNEAMTLAREARKLDPAEPNYADTLGWIYYQKGLYALAVDQLLFSVNQGSRRAEHYYRLGMAYYRNGDRAHAEQTLRRALEIDPTFEEAAEAQQTLAALRAGS